MVFYAIAGGTQEVKRLSQVELAHSKAARDQLFAIFELETNFQIVRENYREFGSELESLGFRPFEFPSRLTWRQTIDMNRVLNRRLVNLLTAFKMYQDHAEKTIAAHFTGVKRVRSQFDAMRKKSQEFEILGYLLDHAQHMALPIACFTIGRSTTGAYVKAQLDADRLRRDASRPWPKDLLDEKNPELGPILHRGLNALGAVHEHLRETVATQRDEAIAHCKSLFDSLGHSDLKPLNHIEFFRRGDPVTDELPARYVDDNGERRQIEPLFVLMRDSINLVKDLVQESSSLENVAEWSSHQGT